MYFVIIRYCFLLFDRFKCIRSAFPLIVLIFSDVYLTSIVLDFFYFLISGYVYINKSGYDFIKGKLLNKFNGLKVCYFFICGKSLLAGEPYCIEYEYFFTPAYVTLLLFVFSFSRFLLKLWNNLYINE